MTFESSNVVKSELNEMSMMLSTILSHLNDKFGIIDNGHSTQQHTTTDSMETDSIASGSAPNDVILHFFYIKFIRVTVI